MSGETIIYKAPPSSCNKLTIEKSLELQQWILDPDSRPYDKREPENDGKLIAHSAGAITEPTKTNVQKQLELQQMILGNTY